jgi:hypothetical protein
MFGSFRDLAFMGAAAGSGVALDPDAQAYITAVENVDGQALEAGVRTAINDFVVGCKADGIWTAIKASCIMAGARTRLGAMVPLVGAAPTSFNFVDADYNRKTGLKGNKINKYLQLNRTNNADPQNSRHFGCYGAFSVPDNSYDGIYGANFSGTGWTSVYIDRRPTPDVMQVYITGTASSPLNTQEGFFGANRPTSSFVVSRNGGVSTQVSSVSQAPSSNDLRLFAVSTAAADMTNGTISFYSIGESLDLALLDARVTDLINAFGAAIP